MNTSQRTQTRNLSTQHLLHRVGWPLLVFLSVVLSTPSLWQPQLLTAHGQTSGSIQFTRTLRFQEVTSGIEYGQTTTGHASKDDLTGPWFINVLRIDLSRATLKIVHALDEGVGLETVSSLATRYGAAAAINGGYFRTTGTYRGESIGLLLLDGKLISEPYNDRADVGLISAGNRTEVIFGHLKFSGEISVGFAKHDVQGLNRPLSANELIVFTPEFHHTSLTNPDGIEVVVRGSRVVAVRDLKGSTEIPSDGYVISAQGSAREWVRQNLRKGSKTAFSWSLNSIEPGEDQEWRHAYSILGAGPQLIKAGKIAITDKQEKMAAGFATDRHPRTAIAKLESGRVLLLTVDGRQPGVSAGMSLNMLAELLLEFGAVEAINLDGGGSTTMVVHDKVVNRPSDQTGERPVSDAILLFSKPK
ncbi:MAG: phosphodiester glycosidase family protein [Pyrinomonadaceae bacterium]